MKFGARILKTGIAITLALIIAIVFNMPSPAFAGIAAVFAMQPTIYRSYVTVLEQVQGNIIGALVAVVFFMLFGSNPIIIGFGAILVIAVNLQLKLENTISLAVVTLIAIMEAPSEGFLLFALYRFLTVMMGVISAFIVNLFFLPPKYEVRMLKKLISNSEETIKWIRMNIRHVSDHAILKEEIDHLRVSNVKLNNLYLLYKEERIPYNNSAITKSRKLVIFRQSISTSTRALETLKLLNRLENEIYGMPESLREAIFNELDSLTSYHEQILLRLSGKIKSDPAEYMSDEVNEYKHDLAKIFLENKKEFEDETCENWMKLFPLIGMIISYNEHVEHLDILVESFQNYHQEDNDLQLETEKE